MTRSGDEPDDGGGVRGLGWLLLMLIVSLAAGWFIVGPGADAPGDENRPIQLIMTVPASTETDPMYAGIIRRFEMDHPHIAVELRSVTGVNYYQKVLVMMASGLAPDLIWMGEGFNEFARRGAFMDITDRLKHETITADFLPQAMAWYQLDGRQLGAPHSIDVQFIVYMLLVFLLGQKFFVAGIQVGAVKG